MQLSVCSYNCCSLAKNIEIVRDLSSKQYDLIFLQETLVTEDRLGELNFIDEHYNVVGCIVASKFTGQIGHAHLRMFWHASTTN